MKSTPGIGVSTVAESGTEICGVVGGGVATDSACTDSFRAFIGDYLKTTHGFQKQCEKSLGMKVSLICYVQWTVVWGQLAMLDTLLEWQPSSLVAPPPHPRVFLPRQA